MVELSVLLLLSMVIPCFGEIKNEERNGGFDRSSLKPKNCPFLALGEEYKVDKVDSYHNYHTLYCDILQPYLRLKRFRFEKKSPLVPVMLEIGFGCGHHVQGASCLMLNRLFNDQLIYYAIDYANPIERAYSCIENFQKEHPKQLQKFWVGDQSNFDFLASVTSDLQKLNTTLDIVIDDGGHRYSQQLASFLMLWPYVSPGGVYVVEDLAADNTFNTLVLKWVQLLGTGKETAKTNKLPSSDLSSDLLLAENMNRVPLPQGVIRIGCGFQICYLKKVNLPYERLPQN